MKQALLAIVLIAIPVAAFTAFQLYFKAGTLATQSLGDLAELKTIVLDVRSMAKAGDLAAAGKRITDFETAWDTDEPTLRPKNQVAWGHIDEAADAAIHALRTTGPTADEVARTLDRLISAIDNPLPEDASNEEVKRVAGVAVSDASGQPIACEEMIRALKASIESAKTNQTHKGVAADFLSKALERCNADDDPHANEFSAQGLALMGQGQF